MVYAAISRHTQVDGWWLRWLGAADDFGWEYAALRSTSAPLALQGRAHVAVQVKGCVMLQHRTA